MVRAARCLVTTGVGNPLSLRISVHQPMTDRPNSDFERVSALWAKHQGPGDVTLGPIDQMFDPGRSGSAHDREL